MSQLQASTLSNQQPGAGLYEFVNPVLRSDRCQQLAADGFLVARVIGQGQREEELRPEDRPSLLAIGRLGDAIDCAIEISLALRGALPPSVRSDADYPTRAADQLTRMRSLGARGLCIVLPYLIDLSRDETLSGTDSEALSSWRELSQKQSVVLLIDERDRELRMLAPTALEEVFEVDNGLQQNAIAAVAEPESTEDREEGIARARLAARTEYAATLQPDAQHVDDLDSLDSEEIVDEGATIDAAAVEMDHVHGGSDGLEANALVPIDDEDELALAAHQHWHRDSMSLFDAVAVTCEEEDQPDSRDTMIDPWMATGYHDEEADEDSQEPREQLLPEALAKPGQTEMFGAEGQALHKPAAASLSASHAPLSQRPPLRPRPPVVAPEAVFEHTQALAEADGPRPVKHIERLYMKHYSPLLNALCRGLEDDDAEAAVALWRRDFERSYSENYTHMRLTGKRPKMVLDAPSLAAQAARVNGARGVQLLLVDSMRFDLGQLVKSRLRECIGDRAACVDEQLLWAALPTVTPTQMRLLARGPRGLRENDPESDRDPAIYRAGSVTTLRRVRIGRRDLLKLDVVEARLRDAGGNFGERMQALACDVADVVARFSESLAPRTLLYVFGDHGFRVDNGLAPTADAQQGGASPEEVLVGAQAWLIGDVH